MSARDPDTQEASPATVAALRAAIDAADHWALTYREEAAVLRAENERLVKALTDCVTKAHDYGTQDGDFVALYLIQTGPIHRAIPLLQVHGITARPRQWRHHYVEVYPGRSGTIKAGKFGWRCLAPGCQPGDNGYRTEEGATREANTHRAADETVEAALAPKASEIRWALRERDETRAALATARADALAPVLALCDEADARRGRDGIILTSAIRAACADTPTGATT